jgi:hypothetical protein
MTVYVLMITQENPLRSETIHSIYTSPEVAEDAANELAYQLPQNFVFSVEPFEVIDEDAY